jgi:hypothetical protein
VDDESIHSFIHPYRSPLGRQAGRQARTHARPFASLPSNNILKIETHQAEGRVAVTARGIGIHASVGEQRGEHRRMPAHCRGHAGRPAVEVGHRRVAAVLVLEQRLDDLQVTPLRREDEGRSAVDVAEVPVHAVWVFIVRDSW